MQIKKQLHINAPKSVIFQNLTDPTQIVQYFPLSAVISDWTVGGQIIFRGPESGEDIGIITALEQDRVFEFTYWNQNHGTENKPENHITICYRLTESADGTEVDMTQSNIPSQEYQALMDPIWDHLLNGLRCYAENSHK